MINLSNVTVIHGKRTLFKNAGFLIRPGDKIGLVGPHGAGKTTVFRLIVGEETPHSGEISINAEIVIGYFSQHAGEMSGRSALEEVLTEAGKVHRIGLQLHELEHRMADPEDGLSDAEMEHYGKLQEEFMHHLGGYETKTRAQTILNGLSIGPDRWDQPVEAFSGGWKMRIALARILVLQPDVLLCDEPTNYRDVASREVLLEALQEFDGTVLLVSHDRYFLHHLANRVFEIDHGRLVTYEGDDDSSLRKRAETVPVA